MNKFPLRMRPMFAIAIAVLFILSVYFLHSFSRVRSHAFSHPDRVSGKSGYQQHFLSFADHVKRRIAMVDAPSRWTESQARGGAVWGTETVTPMIIEVDDIEIFKNVKLRQKTNNSEGRKKQDGGGHKVETIWVNQSIGGSNLLLDRLKLLNAKIAEYRSNLTSILGNTSMTNFFDRPDVLWCQYEDCQHKLSRYPQVQTISMSFLQSELSSNLLIKAYQPWTASPSLCKWIQTRSGTKARYDSVFNRTCRSNSELMDIPLNPVFLNGKPINKNHYWPNNGDSYPDRFYRQPPEELFSMHIFRDALVTNLGDVISSDLKFLPYSCSQDLAPALPPNWRQAPVHREVFVIGQYWGSAYFHKLVENIPRLVPYLEFLRKYDDIPIVVQENSGVTAWHLQALGINQLRLLTGVHIGRIVYLPRATPCGFARPANVQLMASFFRTSKRKYEMEKRAPSRLSVRRPSRNAILLIQRSGTRRFTKHREIAERLAVLARLNKLEFVEFRDGSHQMNSAETVLLFQRAAMVVAPHGAGLSNVLYTPAPCIVIEGVCNRPHVNLCFLWLAHVLGHRYHGIASSGGCERVIDVAPDKILEAAESLIHLVKLTLQREPT